MKRFLADTRGVFAVEVAIIFPLILIAVGGFIDIGQKMNLLRNTQFVVQAAALAGPSQAQAIVDANAALFLPGFQNSVSVTSNGALLTVSMNSSEPALFPMFGDFVTASATVTVANSQQATQ